MSQIELWGLFILSLAAGVWMLAIGIHHIWMQIHTRRWKRTIGNLEEWEIIEHDVKVRGRKRRRYSPVLKYHYEADGKTYTGDRIHFSEAISHFTAQDAQKDLNKFIQTDKLVVYFNPNKPYQSVLIRDAIRAGAISQIIFGSGFIILAIFVTRFLYRM